MGGRPLAARWLAALALAALAGCATRSLPPAAPPPLISPPPAPPPPVESGPSTNDFADLPGWASDDHAAALAAFLATCEHLPRGEIAGACGRARSVPPGDEIAARAFFEQAFRPEPVAGEGLLTAYYSPAYPARWRREWPFTAPLRPRPADLSPRASGTAYADRAGVEARPAADALAWMKPEDLFLLQTQGSGTLVFGDGARRRAVSDGTNGAAFVGVAGPMRQMGLLAPAHASAQAVHDWLAANRGEAAARMMNLNPRYVFFRLRADDGQEPAGAAGVPLPRGRAVAVDRAAHPLGELLWLDADDPALAGARPSYRRLVIALDSGGAIKGAVRADLYLGRGEAAGAEAGQVRHRLRLWRLTPVNAGAPSLASTR